MSTTLPSDQPYHIVIEEKPKSRWRHPLVVATFGFLLNGLLLSGLTYVTTSILEQNERRHELRENWRQSVRSLSELIHNRRNRAELVRSSIGRDASVDELIDRKARYDEAYNDWNVKLQSNLFIIGEFLSAAEYQEVQRFIEDDIVGKFMIPIDECITDAFDAYVSGAPDQAKAEFIACKLTTLVHKARPCMQTFLSELDQLSHGGRPFAEAKAVMTQACDLKL